LLQYVFIFVKAKIQLFIVCARSLTNLNKYNLGF